MFKKVIGIMLTVMLSVSIAGCGQQATESEQVIVEEQKVVTTQMIPTEEETVGASEEMTQASESKIVIDSKGREIVLENPAETIVVLNSDAYAMVKMLGFEDKVIGVTDSMIKSVAGAENKQSVGAWNDPSVEKIIELAPDLVVGYSSYLKDENVKIMEDANIKVAMFDFFNTAEVAREVSQLGILLGNETKANEFTEFVNSYLNLIAERTKDISEEDKVILFWEGDTEYKTVAQGTAANEVITAAGCINIAEAEATKYPEISDEWVIENNPQVIIKTVATAKEALGWGITDDTNAKALFDTLVTRTGWENIDAVKNNKVVLLSTDIALSPQGSVVGALYIAKMAYPELFEDIDPNEVNKEMKKKFLDLNIEGHIYTYPQMN